ncbi:PQQ repeat-containing enzyme [Basidiobolus meristosporus CBS 931.73]|uniref:PQQ repeat-containing enzyme n=1 Tax=Basidiobolus meristosporus CBS 931.73 TaxID=1314790 RepID=A0A1Y1XXM0_9FUNG|nr:PQQ repeat-containing enzyme [Basidiobolus meristosporus CBS 931.73]|eukprot:ORX90488.1 PQQ repeat-containing enzyme [Basidiobolus meristosporus CBS 931.73]
MEQNTLRRRGVGLIGVDKEQVFPGYTLFAPLTSPDSVYLVDNDGNQVHQWKLPYRPGRHARILANGNLAVNGALPDEPHLFLFWEKYRGGAMLQVDPQGNIVREHKDPYAHHDAHHQDNGNILYTTLEELSDEDAQRVLGGVPGTEAPGGKVYSDIIKEVDADNNEIWSWRAFEHLPKETFPLQAHYPREHWPLINTVYPLKDGNILASLRSVSAVIIIERSTGKVIWHLDSNVVAQQHNANELDNGNILIFDNGAFRTGESVNFSRIIEVDRETKQIVWEYRDPQMEAFFTPFMGGAQRLGNGNTLITEAAFGRIFEVTKDGQLCWEYVNPHFAKYKVPQLSVFKHESNALFRAYKYSAEEIPWLETGN